MSIFKKSKIKIDANKRLFISTINNVIDVSEKAFPRALSLKQDMIDQLNNMLSNTPDSVFAFESKEDIIKTAYAALYQFACNLYASPSYKINGEFEHDLRNDELIYLARTACYVSKELGFLTDEEVTSAMDNMYKLQ